MASMAIIGGEARPLCLLLVINHPILRLPSYWVRGSNLAGGHNRLSCPCSADTALKPYLTLPYLPSYYSFVCDS